MAVCTAGAQGSYTIAQLTQFLHSSTHELKDKISDKEAADFVKKMKLTERLDDAAIQRFMADGVGPQTIAALKMQRDRTANLPTPHNAAIQTVPAQSPPSSEEQAAILDAVRDYALTYSQNLPNFLCLEIATTYGAAKADGPWQKVNEISSRLAYYEQRETYKPVSLNGAYTQQDYDKIRGSKSIGDFGSMLRGIFEPSSMARFEWLGWATWDGQPAMDFSYRVEQEHSGYEVGAEGVKSVIAGYHGKFVVDAKRRAIVKLIVVADDLPDDFPVRVAENTIVYREKEIAGRSYLLPDTVSILMTGPDGVSRIEKQFRGYNKYSADATISFGDPDPPPSKKK
jgi:hypothetical protein